MAKNSSLSIGQIKTTMKKVLFLFFFTISTILYSQENCGDILPVQTCSTDTFLCLEQMTPAPNITTSSNLPTIEYAIVDNNTPAPSGNGNVVIGFDSDGVFSPIDFGLQAGGSFDVVPLAYDLPVIQGLIDDILTGFIGFPPFGISCCAAIEAAAGLDICDTLNAYGINSGSDFMSLQQVSALAGGGQTDSLSIIDFLFLIDSANTQLASAPGACGGGTTICYAVGNNCTSHIVADSAIITVPHTSDELVEVSSTIISSGMVNSPDSVIYRANMCIQLEDGFEVNVGAKFIAETVDICE